MNLSTFIKLSFKASIKRGLALCMGLVISLLTHQALANYNFSSSGAATTAPNCSGTANGVYTCTAGLSNGGQPINIDNSGGPVIINVTGAMNINERVQILSSNNAVVFNVNGTLRVECYTVGNSAAASKTAFFVTGDVTMSCPTIHADIYATGTNNITLGNSSTSPYVNGVVQTNQGVITVYGVVQGCVKSNTGNVNSIILGNAAAVPFAGVSCGGTSSTSCVTNNTGRPMPGICTAPSLIAQYHLDEASWSGTPNETKDTAGYSGGPFDGQGIGSPLPTPTKSIPARSGSTGTCGYAYFQNSTNGSAMTLDGLPVSTAVGDKTTVSFWMYWNGQDAMPIGWNQYDLWFYNGSFGFNTDNGTDVYGISNAGLANAWHHVMAVFVNGNANLSTLYIDGVLQSLTQRSGTPKNTNAYVQSTLQVSGYQAFNNWRFAGSYIDEVKVYNGEVTQAQVTADYNATHVCPTPKLVAYYALDEASWNGTLNETKDIAGYSGGPFDGQGIGSPLPTPASSNPVKSGATGTCGYANFIGTPGGAFTLDNLPVSTTVGDKTTVSFWMYWNGQDAMPIGWYEYDLWLYNGSFGFNTNNFDVYGISSAGLVNAWHHVTAVFTNGNATLSTLYIDGTLQSLTQRSGTPKNTNAYVRSTLQVSGFQQSSIYRFVGSYIDEVKVYNGEVTQEQVTADYQAVHACPTAGTQASSFNCTIVGGTSNTGHLYTQVAGTPFNIDVIALKSTGATETNYVQSGTKNVTLEFVDGSGSTACASRSVLSPAISKPVSFAVSDAGRKTVSGINIGKAYRDLRCRVTDANQTPSVVGCSSDNFAVRPTSLTVTSGNANADSSGTSTTLTPRIKAGANFSLTATADVVGYDGTPVIDASKLSAHTGATQVGTLSGSFGAANISTSVATGAGFNYSEVGYFRFGENGVYDSNFTSVDSGNGDCATGFVASGGLNACSFGNTVTTSYFGRFIPDHFAVTPTSVTPACSNLFTYFGQDGLTTGFTLRAENSANVITQNYTGSFAKLGLNTWTNYNFSAATLPTGSALSASTTAPTGSWSNGSATVVAKHLVSRPASATATTGIIISAAPVDSDGVTMAITPISASSNFKYGRLYMPNTYGSELLQLTVPIEAQYWNGTAYQRNKDDSCTVFPVSSIKMDNFTSNLAACETYITNSGNVSMSPSGAGKATITLFRPGNGNNGSVNLTVNVNGASGNTCNSSNSIPATSAAMPWFSTNASRATFGLFKTPVIYMRENF